jgi:hypothetical protein
MNLGVSFTMTHLETLFFVLPFPTTESLIMIPQLFFSTNLLGSRVGTRKG